MKREQFDIDRADNSAVRASVHATFRRMAVRGALIAACATLLTAAAVIYGVFAPSGAQLATVMVPLMVICLGSSVAVAVYCARWTARITTDPLELMLNHLAMIGEVPSSPPNWEAGRALSASAISEDIKLIDRLFRSAQRRSRTTLADLTKAQEMATAQNEAKTQFLATMSHELRTPLNAILGYAMLLQEDAEDAGNSAAVSDLERIQQAGRNLLGLINDILDLSRLETGKAIVHRTIVDVRDLVDQVVDASTTEVRRKGNTFSLDVTGNLGVIVADGAKLRQCIENLLSNAFKFTHGGSVTLSVASTQTAAFPAILFTVADNGIGIGAEDLSGLFEAFEQADNQHTRRFGGTGIGLTITRRLARMMGGDCWAESTEGEGSKFHLLVPQGLDRSENETSAEALVAYSADVPATVGKTVLIIEDDDDSLQLMRRWLGKMGFNVLAATDPEVGLACARENKPDLILLDALMPRLSGYEVLRDLRSDSATSGIPVVVITVDDDARRGLDAGASDFIRKPIMQDELRSLVEVYCGKVTGEILVIDDDEDAADLIGRYVREVGFASRHASNGLEGLTMARESRPKAIVLDLTMPGLDGFGVIDHLHEDKTLRDVPLIVLSGRKISADEHRQLVASGHRYFIKGASTPRQIAQSLKELVA